MPQRVLVYLAALALLAPAPFAQSHTHHGGNVSGGAGGSVKDSVKDGASDADLADAVTLRGVRAHMAALQQVADDHGGNRAAGSPGYAASVRYVERTLRAAGYAVRRQPFSVTVTDTLAQTGRVVGGETLTPLIMDGSPNTAAGDPPQAPLSVPAAPLGCDAADFAGTRGTVVLVERGVCTFATKARHAARAGAVAVLVYNEAGAPADDLFNGSLDDGGAAATVPTAALTRAEGEGLREQLERGAVRVTLELRSVTKTLRTANVIAETPATTGKMGGEMGEEATQKVVMLGAHLDSVPAGPGVNDNGSGSALVLELALQLAQTGAGGVRFAFWGAEELGLLGSSHYVGALSPAELREIRAYLNFDMLSSPNAAPFAYGNPALTALFTTAFAAQDLILLPDTLGGRSDHAPFEAAGVPVAGLFSGAEGSKTLAETRSYGGTVVVPYDACYHRACDTLAHTDTPTARRYLDLMADAAADAVAALLAEVGR